MGNNCFSWEDNTASLPSVRQQLFSYFSIPVTKFRVIPHSPNWRISHLGDNPNRY